MGTIYRSNVRMIRVTVMVFGRRPWIEGDKKQHNEITEHAGIERRNGIRIPLFCGWKIKSDST